ncbi:MAG: mechanosensitive ion channel [Candidatus Omnitrophota bacterium]|nr:mechanosensitive ion channel [Candidatus Omnitrophota bacterium]
MMVENFVFEKFSFHIFVSLALLILVLAVKKAVVHRINSRVEEVNARHNYRKLAVYICNTVFVVVLGFIWIRRINFGLFLSIIGAGVVISLADYILSLAGWLFIIARKPFVVGDRIQIGSVKGDVLDLRTFFITLMEIGGWVQDEQSTGRIVYIPNNFIFKNPVYNYTHGFNFIWNEIKITITFESNYNKASQICLNFLNEFHNSWARDLEQKIRQAQNFYAIHYKELTPIVYLKIVDSGILLSLRYLVEPQKRRSSENALSAKVLEGFSRESDIRLAYTTYRLVE